MNPASLICLCCVAFPALAQTPTWQQNFTQGTVHSLALSPDQTMIAMVGQERALEVRDAKTGSLLRVIGDPKEDTFAVAWSQAALVVAGRTQRRGGTLSFFDPLTFAPRQVQALPDSVVTLALAPDGRTLACGGLSGGLGLWDAASGSLTRELRKPGTKAILTLAFRPDGQLLACGGPGEKGDEDGEIQFWEPATGRPKLKVQLPRTPFSLAFSPDGTRLAVGDWGGVLTLLDPGTGAQVSQARGHSWWVRALAYSPDGRHLFSAGLEDLVVWNTATGAPMRTHLEVGCSATRIVFNRDGGTLYLGGWTKRRSALVAFESKGLTAGNDPPAREWTLKGGTPVSLAFDPQGTQLWVRFQKSVEALTWPTGQAAPPLPLPEDTQGLWDFALSPNGRGIAVAGEPFRLATGDGSGKPLQLRPGPSQVLGVAFGKDPDHLTLRTNEGQLMRFSLKDGSQIPIVASRVNGAFALDAQGRWLATTAGVAVELRSPTDGSLRHRLPIANRGDALAFDRSGRRLAVLDSPPRVWDLETLEPFPAPKEEPDENGRWSALAMDPLGRILALVRNPSGMDLGQGEIYLLDVPNGHWLARFILPAAQRAVAFHPSGRSLVALPEKGPLRIWDLGPLRDRLPSPKDLPKSSPPLRLRAEDSVYSMALSPDGAKVALATATGQIQIWNVNTRQRLNSWQAAPAYTPQPMAFSPDGRSLALGASGLDLWDWEKGLLLRRLKAPAVRFGAVVFTPDGASLLAHAEAGFSRWNGLTGDLEEEIKGFQPPGKSPAFRGVEPGVVPLAGGGWAQFQYGFIRILDADFKMQAQAQGPSHSGLDLPLAASPDGRILALGSGDQIELWQVSPLRRLGVLGSHSSHLTALGFTPNGHLLSAGFDGVLRIWENLEITTPDAVP